MAVNVSLYIIGVLLWSCFSSPAYGEIFSASTPVGTITGSHHEDQPVKTFIGIPYAVPPTGQRRFKKPEPMPGFQTPFEAVKFGPACPQTAFIGMGVYTNTSEDCLYLNVYVPDQTPDKEAGHAVMVWIHGGGLKSGAGESYPGADLSAFGNIIVVTINYRLWIFGFMDPGDGTVPGNLGFHDQHLAIKWVNKNIGAFGGDNTRVTIFGESAGGSSVVFQGLYTANNGFIHRIIAQSGTHNAMGIIETSHRAKVLKLAEQLACVVEGNTSKAVSCIKSFSTTEIIDKLESMARDPDLAFATQYLPTIDEEILKSTFVPLTNVSKSDGNEEITFFRSLDFMSGFNDKDGGVFLVTPILPISNAETFTINREQFRTNYVPIALSIPFRKVPEITNTLVLADYTDWRDPNLPENNRDQYIKLIGDAMFAIGSVEMSRLHSIVSDTTPQNTYAFLFSAIPTNHVIKTPPWVEGANHADEIPYIFLLSDELFKNLVLDREVKPFEEWEHQLSKHMATYWTNFAKSGNPNQPSAVPTNWPRYEHVNQKFITFDRDMSDNSVGDFFYAREANLWLDVIPEVTKASSRICSSSQGSLFSPLIRVYIICIYMCLLW